MRSFKITKINHYALIGLLISIPSVVMGQTSTAPSTTNTAQASPVEQWEPVASILSDWVATGTKTLIEDWSPSIKNQSKQFVQKQTYQQTFTRLEQKRERNKANGKIRLSGKPIRITEDKKTYVYRTVTARPSAWTDSVRTGSSPWYPASDKQTREYLQGRTASQLSERSIEYYVGNELIDTVFDQKTKGNIDEIRTVTIEYGDWRPVGEPVDCNEWLPKSPAVFNEEKIYQTATCTLNEERSINHVSEGVVVHSVAEKRINENAKAERYLTASGEIINASQVSLSNDLVNGTGSSPQEENGLNTQHQEAFSGNPSDGNTYEIGVSKNDYITVSVDDNSYQ